MKELVAAQDRSAVMHEYADRGEQRSGAPRFDEEAIAQRKFGEAIRRGGRVPRVVSARRTAYESEMSTVSEIENAIRGLSAAERRKLAESLPKLVPELDGDARWEEIIRDPTPRPKLSALGDEVDRQYRENPDQFIPLTEEEFDKHE